MKRIGCLFGFTLTILSVPSTAAQGPSAAVPLDPVTAILDAFHTHNVVALGEPHMIVQGHALRVALIRDPRFPRLVNDIVWECGSARYQGTMDRFMNGEAVSDAELKETWRNTVGSINVVCDLPIYEAFIREVKVINDRLPETQKVRVLLGDPPADWSVIKSVAELMPWAEARDSHAADLIGREVLAKNRRALVIYGDGHLVRKSLRSNYERDDLGPLVDRLGDNPAARIFNIYSAISTDLATIQPDIATWTAPKLVLLKGTTLGVTDFEVFASAGSGSRPNRWAQRGGKRADIPKDQWRARRMDDQFDALLYLGRPSSMTRSQLAPTTCADTAYINTRLARMTMVGVPTDGLKKICGIAP
jgi:hypothetical protein